MRYFLGLALATFILVSWLGFTGLPSTARQDLAEDYPTYLWQVHGQEKPLPTGLLSQSAPPEGAVAGEMVTYGQLEGQPLQGYLARPAGKSGPLPAVIGSLNTALLFPDQLDGAVIYYGGQLETNPARLAPLKMPILGIFGELDRNPSVETVRQFEAALKGLGKTVTVYIYPNADHAFANPSGERYNPEAAADAWARTREFLAKYLK